jgi:NAD/NADP transhydrogenase beta subunit
MVGQDTCDLQIVSALDKIAKVLGAFYVHSLSEAELPVKVQHLNQCGFTTAEISQLLDTTPNNIRVALHRARKPRKSKRKNAKRQ